MSISLIAGLGNPGNQYKETRHNVGWWWLDLFCEKFNVNLKDDKKLFAEHGKTTLQQHTIHLLKPNTFMNLSGKALLACQQFYKIPISETLVVHDDLDLPVGTIRFKKEGGHGGHNGLRDIIQRTATTAFYRLRIGIGHPGHKNQVHNYVLSKPSTEEEAKILKEMHRSLCLISSLFENEIERFIHTLHTNEVNNGL